jgi:two-component system nitrate/nitrite response regulator NarL
MINPKGPKIKIFLVDDHPVVRTGVKAILKKKPYIKVTGEASGGVEAVEKILAYPPDIVLLDVSLPDINGTEVIKRVKEKNKRIKILGYSIHNSGEYISEFIRLGAHGYILKDSPPDDLLIGIEAVYSGKNFFSSQINEELMQKQIEKIRQSKQTFLKEKKLTNREYEVLIRLANGMTNKEIAETLSLSIRTVEAHREHLMQKLEAKNIAVLVKYALTNFVLDSEKLP